MHTFQVLYKIKDYFRDKTVLVLHLNRQQLENS